MNPLTNWIENSEVSFWLVGIGGLLFILLIRSAVKSLLNRIINRDNTQIFVATLVNWVSLFAVAIFLFTYFSRTSFMYQTLFVFGDTQITLVLILTILFALLLSIKLSNVLRRYLLPSVYNKYNVDKGLRSSINTLIHYIIVILAVLISLSSIGFNLTSLTVFASVLGVGIGFGLQNIMSNFISGIIILFERPFKVGDRVIIDGIIADVEDIKMRATIVHTRKHERMIIPNSYFLEERLVNRSYADTRLRVTVNVSVPYESDVLLVKNVLEESVLELREETGEEILTKPEPRIFFEDFGESSLDFTVWVWIETQTDEREFIIPSKLRFKIVEKFEANNLTFSSPRRAVHFISDDVS